VHAPRKSTEFNVQTSDGTTVRGVWAEKLQHHNEMHSFRQIPSSFTAITTNTLYTARCYMYDTRDISPPSDSFHHYMTNR